MRRRACILWTVLVLAGCVDSSNQPGITPDPEESAKLAFPDIPDSAAAMANAERGSKLFRSFTAARTGTA
jgi:hypothetical protein